MVGKIIHIVKDKGYGFIQSDSYPSNIFFHAQSLKNALFNEINVGDIVEFAPAVTTNKGNSTQEVSIQK